jgi:CDP-diacylglycerol--glycerol-3-phosphate 3-phosphatidyltransferase
VNLPIALTLFRIVLVPLIIVFLISSDRVHVVIAAVIFVAASVTDWLDGRVARRWNQVTRLGTRWSRSTWSRPGSPSSSSGASWP